MTAAALLGWSVWAAITASIIGSMVGGGVLAYQQWTGSICHTSHRAQGLLCGSILLGGVAGTVNAVIT